MTQADTTLRIKLPPKLLPVFAAPNKFIRGSFGGRGSAKTRSFAKMAAVKGAMFAQEGREGIILCAREFMNSLDDSSLAEVKAAIASEPWLIENYEVGEKYVRTKDGRVEFKFAGLRHNLDSIKSKARILLCWVDEAEPVTETAWEKLFPTVREEGSEIWVTWNPERRGSDTDKMFRKNYDPSDMIIVEMNWRDNIWFPENLDRQRLKAKLKNPDRYGHIWEGEYATTHKGAYYASLLADAKAQGRICRLAYDPLVTVRFYHDLAGSSDKADAYAMWPVQFIGREIRVLGYYETSGQAPNFHIQWARDWCFKRKIKRAKMVLPHDGKNIPIEFAWRDYWMKASDEDVEFDVIVRPNAGKGAAMTRVTCARETFPRIWFDEESTEAGRQALGWYHAKLSDDDRNIDMGPEHDWSSHGSDAFGEMCLDYEEPRPNGAPRKRVNQEAGSWMGRS